MKEDAGGINNMKLSSRAMGKITIEKLVQGVNSRVVSDLSRSF